MATQDTAGDTPETATSRRFGLTPRQGALVLLWIAPALFASNMLMARAMAETLPPVGLAFWRWTVALLFLLPFTASELWRSRAALRREWADLLVLGALGMGVCGAFVYIGADTTTATNIGLIYSASPVLIVLLARFYYGEAFTATQALGVSLSLIGVVAVICRGDLGVLSTLSFSVGDLWILAGMAGWALYSILLRHRPTRLSLITRFAAICAGGVLVLLPFTLWEAAQGAVMPRDGEALLAVLFLALVSSIGAYLSYARIQSVLGAGPTSLLMYLIPLYNGGLAFLLLGERLELYHLVGAVFVLPGIYLATRRPQPQR